MAVFSAGRSKGWRMARTAPSTQEQFEKYESEQAALLVRFLLHEPTRDTANVALAFATRRGMI
jgi:hypothetical protein